MIYNFVNVRTDKGGKYSRKILRSIRWLNEHKYPNHEFRIFDLTIEDFMGGAEVFEYAEPNNSIIHPRCAHPDGIKWIRELRRFEEIGYKVVNSVDTITTTADKLKCSLLLQDKVNHPKSWEYRRDMTNWEFVALLEDIDEKLDGAEFIIAKPLTSINQGADVKKIKIDTMGIEGIRTNFNNVPGNKIVIQEYVPYTALHRVIVIGGKALPYTFVDYANDPRKNGEWKVSCCLNRTTMQFNPHPERMLLELAEKTQAVVNGSINFIDVFHRHGMRYVIGEINTACSLNIHERLAKKAGRKDWNIHYRIAKQLVKELIG